MVKSLDNHTISCVIPTYNRCPNRDRPELNPPWWAANSLDNQKNVGELIFVDDCSDDFTEETINKIRKKVNFEVKYMRNNERSGSGKSRNLGVEKAQYEKIWFMDDDCVVIDGSVLPKLEYTFDNLRARRKKVGAITLPVSGDSLEHKLVPKDEIGKVDKQRGVMLGCYTKFPLEYLEEGDFYLDKKLEIVKPLKIELMGGVFLCSKDAFQEAGGFPTTPWRNACAEEPHLMMNMQEKGYEVFYLPSLDPKFRVFHCRYGDPHFKRISFDMNVDGISFNEILRESSNRRKDSGNRVSRPEEIYSNIISDMFIMFNFFNENVGMNNLRTKYNLLNRGEIFSGVEKNVDIFKRAVKDGVELLREEGKLTDGAERYISSEYLS